MSPAFGWRKERLRLGSILDMDGGVRRCDETVAAGAYCHGCRKPDDGNWPVPKSDECRLDEFFI